MCDEMVKQKQYLHEQIYEHFREKIEAGDYPVGMRLPREIDLAKTFEVSRHTVRKALDRLHTEGLVYRTKGVGTFVKSVKAGYNLSNVSSFTEIIEGQQGRPNSTVLRADLIEPTEEVSNKLALGPEEKCYLVERIRKDGEDKLCYEQAYISAEHCPDIDRRVTPKTSLFNLYENVYGLPIESGDYSLEATKPTSKVADLLDVDIDASLLFMRANIFLSDGSPLYYVKAYYVGEKYVFTVTLSR